MALAKQAKESAARRRLLKPRVTMATKPQPQVGQGSGSVSSGRVAESTTSAAAMGGGGLDSRIDELLKYIEGAEAKPKRTSGKTNPKRRGTSSRK